MKNSFRFAAFVLALTAVCGLATAQFEVNGPNASLTMQGQVPSVADPVAHNVNVATPGNFVLNIDSGVNSLMGIIMLASLAELTGPQFPTPLWGGSVDVGDNTVGSSSVLIIGDGIGFTINPFIDAYFRTDAATVILPTNDFLLAYSVNQFFCGGRNAWQAIVQEPGNPPIFIDNTEAGDANYTSGQALVLLTGDDGTVNVPFLGGNSFSFHGVTYTDIYVVGNGYACFGGFSSVVAAGFIVDTVSFLNSEPAIAVCTTDWGIGNTGPNDGVYYEETVDTINGGCSILISWGDVRAISSGAPGMAHFADIDTNNQIEMVLSGEVDPVQNPCGFPAAGTSGNFSLRWPRLDVTANTRPGDGAFGHTPGGAALVGLQASTDMLGQVTATGTGVAGIEEHDNNGTNATILGWDGAGAARSYNSFFAATGMQVDYVASTSVIPGDLGYISIPVGTVPDDVEGFTGTITTAGGTANFVGKFFGFGAGTVDITDSSATTYTLGGTVTSGSGPLFVSEGLDVVYPPLVGGPATATFNFGSGYVETINFTVLSPCSVVQSFTLFDDGSTPVTLTVPVTHYGVVYNTIFLCSNGTVNMTAGHADFTESMAEFFGGNGTPGNSNFGLCYTDLNFGGQTSGATYDVIEDTCSGEVTVSFANQNYWNSGAPAGTFSITMNWLGVPDQTLFNFQTMIDDAANLDTGIVGIGDGVTGGDDTDLGTLGGIDVVIPGYASAGLGPDSIAELMPTGTIATRLNTIIGANGAGTFAVLNSGVGGILVAF